MVTRLNVLFAHHVARLIHADGDNQLLTTFLEMA
jgi:hypothetical protein